MLRIVLQKLTLYCLFQVSTTRNPTEVKNLLFDSASHKTIRQIEILPLPTFAISSAIGITSTCNQVQLKILPLIKKQERLLVQPPVSEEQLFSFQTININIFLMSNGLPKKSNSLQYDQAKKELLFQSFLKVSFLLSPTLGAM